MHLLTVPEIVKFDLVKQSNKFKISATDLKTGIRFIQGTLKLILQGLTQRIKKLYLGNGLILELDIPQKKIRII